MVDKTGICFDCWKNPNCDKDDVMMEIREEDDN